MRVNESYRFSYTMKKKMIIFSEVNRFKKLHPHGLPPPKQIFQISNSSPIRTTELKLYQCGFTKVLHRILMSKAPALGSPKRKWELATSLRAREGERDYIAQEMTCSVRQSSQASAEHRKGQSMPEASSTSQQKTEQPAQNQVHVGWLQWLQRKRKAPFPSRKTV